MREIKFKAWDGEKIYVPHYLGLHKDFNVSVFDNGRALEDARTNENCILMQFTGLKDENKIDIYEGDIVKCWTRRFPESITTGIVIYNEHCAAFQVQYEGLLGGNPSDFIHKWHFFEVIGNKFESKK